MRKDTQWPSCVAKFGVERGVKVEISTNDRRRQESFIPGPSIVHSHERLIRTLEADHGAASQCRSKTENRGPQPRDSRKNWRGRDRFAARRARGREARTRGLS